MKFPLHLVIQYAHTKPTVVDTALKEFFGKPPNKPYNDENIMALFAEWLIFEYRQANGSTFLIEYILRNPDLLNESQLNRLRQIVQTQIYSQFQIMSVVPGKYLRLKNIFTGKLHDVFDQLGSSNINNHGSLIARIACVDNFWYLVGANPLFIPMTYTPRMLRMLKGDANFTHVSAKDSAQILIGSELNPPQPPKPATKAEILQKRKELEKTYLQKAPHYGVTLPFADYIQAVYNEHDRRPLDFWQDLCKKGLTNKFIVEETQLHQNIWNYFPHKELNNFSPAEMYNRLKR